MSTSNNNYNYNEEKLTYDYEYDFGDSSDEELKTNRQKYTHVDFETFIKKECKGTKGGWLISELRNFCDILGLNNKGSKSDLCRRLSIYYKNQQQKNNEQIEYQKQIIKQSKMAEEYKKRMYEAELHQRELLEKVYKEQQKIREKEM